MDGHACRLERVLLVQRRHTLSLVCAPQLKRPPLGTPTPGVDEIKGSTPEKAGIRSASTAARAPLSVGQSASVGRSCSLAFLGTFQDRSHERHLLRRCSRAEGSRFLKKRAAGGTPKAPRACGGAPIEDTTEAGIQLAPKEAFSTRSHKEEKANGQQQYFLHHRRDRRRRRRPQTPWTLVGLTELHASNRQVATSPAAHLVAPCSSSKGKVFTSASTKCSPRWDMTPAS